MLILQRTVLEPIANSAEYETTHEFLDLARNWREVRSLMRLGVEPDRVVRPTRRQREALRGRFRRNVR